jgi:hypothetical protein
MPGRGPASGGGGASACYDLAAVLGFLRFLVTAVAIATLTGSLAEAGVCKPARYQIMGKVFDAGGRPVADAAVRLLLDRVSAKKFRAEGPRASLVRTNASGTYLTLIDCERARGVTDAPDPCAGRPRHLTVSVEATGYRLKLVEFKLKELEIIKDAGGCLVQVPDLRLSNS